MSLVLITLDIIDYLPQNFRFDNFSFIFSSDGHDLEDQINFMSKNQLTHKTPLNKRDIRYSIKVLRNDSLIGICDFIIPYVLLSKKEPFYEKICQVNMTDSTKRMLFGGLNSSNTLKINIRATMQYIQEKVLVKQNTNFRKEKANKAFSPKYQTKPIKKNQNNNIIMNNNNNLLNNQNFVFNKQQIPMTVTTKKIAQKSNTKNNINKYQTKPQKQNIADVMIQQQQNKKKINNNIYQKPEKKIIETNEEDPNDKSTLDEDISQPIQLIDKEFTEFMPKFIEKNPLEQLGQFKDINEMLIYTKNVIDKLLCYQQEYYERLKNSVTLNHRLNDLLMKYNEKYRNIVKKVHRLNEETNSTDMRKDAVVSIHRAENTNLKQIIPLKMKELKLYQEMCGTGIQDIISNKENNNNNNDEKGKIEQILTKLLKNCIKEYGPLDTLVKENSKINEEDKKSMKILNDQLCNENNENNNNEKLEFVVADNYNNLDEKIDNELKNIYEKNKEWPMVQIKKIDDNVYEYEDKKLEFKEDGENLNIVCEGEEMRFADFVEFMNEQGEEKNMEN